MSKIIFLHLAITFFMTGVIWIVQLLHYPSFRFFPETDFSSRMKWHQTRISWIVIPAMMAELGTGIWICWKLGFQDWVWNTNLLILILIWLSTAILQGPTHQKLSKGKNDQLIQFLCNTNWLRVALWMIRSIMLTYFMW